MGYDLFIKSQLASGNQLSGLVWYKLGHVTPQNLGFRIQDVEFRVKGPGGSGVQGVGVTGSDSALSLPSSPSSPPPSPPLEFVHFGICPLWDSETPPTPSAAPHAPPPALTGVEAFGAVDVTGFAGDAMLDLDSGFRSKGWFRISCCLVRVQGSGKEVWGLWFMV